MPRISVVIVLVCLAVFPGPAHQPASQPAGQPSQPPLTFKVEVNYVEIDATVTDRQGSPVRDLTRDDFQLLEEGKPQKLTVFSHVELPVERADPPLFRAAAVEPDVRSNRREFDGRLFVLILDDLHTSITRTVRLRAGATEFIQRYLGANDVAAVIRTGGTRTGTQEFTGSRALLLRAVNQIAGQKLPSAALERSQNPLARAGADVGNAGAARSSTDPNEAERAYKARRLLSALKGVAEYLSGVRGRRKAVVLFSEGIDYDIGNPIENRYASDIVEELGAAIGAATRGNVSFYTIDPRGLVGFDDLIEAQAGPEDPSPFTSMLDETRRSQDSLRVLAEETGGVAVVNRNDYRESFERIIRDNSSYYVLGYYSDNARRDGRFRSVDVTVRNPGLTVRARKGYVAPRGNPPAITSAGAEDASPELREALKSPVPVSGLGLAASAVPFRGGSSKASMLIVLEIDGSRFRFVDKSGKLWNEIEIAAVPFDSAGKPSGGVRDTITMTPRPQTRDIILERGVRILRRLDLPPGRYQLRVGARESGSGSTGSVMLDIDAPDFRKGNLVMSGLVLTSQTANQIPTARVDEQLKDVLPAPATAIRAFSRADQLTAFAEIYDSVPTPHRVEITTTATDDGGKVVFNQKDERLSSELHARGDGFGHVSTIPLKGFAPGRYVLRVDARPLMSGGDTVFRELELTVR